VPFVWAISLVGAFACFYTMLGLPRTAWERFGIWLVLGALIYAFYGYRNSQLRRVQKAGPGLR
jgi:APA family basic amino acid/polyamine antiporter